MMFYKNQINLITKRAKSKWLNFRSDIYFSSTNHFSEFRQFRQFTLREHLSLIELWFVSGTKTTSNLCLYEIIKNSAPFWTEADFAQFRKTSWSSDFLLHSRYVNMSLSLNFDILPWGNMVLINSQGFIIIIDELNIWPWSTFLCLITASRMPCYSSCTTS